MTLNLFNFFFWLETQITDIHTVFDENYVDTIIAIDLYF